VPQTIHVIPTGFDRHRLIAPFVKGGLEADKVILVYTRDEEEDIESHEEEVRLANEIVDKLKSDFENYADIPEVEKMSYAEISNIEGGHQTETTSIAMIESIRTHTTS